MIDDIELERGYWMAVENASEIIKEAQLLKTNNHISRAYTLFQLAMEECGKASLIYYAIIEFYNGVKIDQAHLNRNGFSDHKIKTKSAIGLEFNIRLIQKQTTENRRKLLKDVSEKHNNVYKSNNLKNNSMYVHLLDNKFVSPSTIIDKKMVDELEQSTVYRYELAKGLFVTLKDIKRANTRLKQMTQKEYEDWVMDLFGDY